LKLTFTKDLMGEVDSTTLHVRKSNSKWAEYKFAVPIAVKGQTAPQILAKYYRPNWLDFETFDRFEPPPKSLEAKVMPGKRWELCSWYRIDKGRAEWVNQKEHWESYTFGEPAGGQSFQSPNDCNFRFR